MRYKLTYSLIGLGILFPLFAGALTHINPAQIATGTQNQVLTTIGNTTTWSNSSGGFNTTTTINGLSGAITFATGTLGLDFNWATSTNTLTLNIPTAASTTTRGLLTTADFLNFFTSARATTTITCGAGLTGCSSLANNQTLVNSAPNFNTTTSVNGLTGAITGLNIYNTTTSLNGLTGAITGLNLFNVTTTLTASSGISIAQNGQTYSILNSAPNFNTTTSLNGLTGAIVNLNIFNTTTTLNGLTGSINIQGTPQQVNVATSSGVITLSTPQNINTTSSPTFASATLSNFTAGSILFATTSGALTQSNANLFWDSGNKRLGIGTALPTFPLDISAPSGVGRILSTTATNAAILRLNNNGGDMILARNDSVGSQVLTTGGLPYSAVLDSQGTSSVQLAVNDSVAMTIINGGSVGIGTNAPGAKFVVSKNAANLPAGPTGMVVQIGQADATLNRFVFDSFAQKGQLVFRRSDNTAASGTALTTDDIMGDFSAIGYGSTGYRPGAAANLVFAAAEPWTDTANGTYIDFYTTPKLSVTDTQVMRLTDAGSLGIGTTAPSELLTVNGHIAQSGASDTVSACGTSPSITGKNGIGTVTEGTTATGCTVTFGTAFKLSTTCVVSSDSGLGLTFTKGSTTLVITNVGALSGTSIDYICMSHG